MLLEKYEIPYTLLCPSLPVNRRIVKDGVLIVDGKPIAEGHMAHHPLNPYLGIGACCPDEAAGKYPCMIIGEELLSCSEEMIMEEVKSLVKNNSHFYIIRIIQRIIRAKDCRSIWKERLLTGGSGILEHLAAQYRENMNVKGENILPTWTEGKGIALSGSQYRHMPTVQSLPGE